MLQHFENVKHTLSVTELTFFVILIISSGLQLWVVWVHVRAWKVRKYGIYLPARVINYTAEYMKIGFSFFVSLSLELCNC